MLVLLATLCCVVATLAAPSAESEAEAQGQIWAVLVAGSKGWENYRHQADICHAYQIFHRHGIPDSNIILMMYDDIAYNIENPNKGVIINTPNGPNVYENVLKDYTGEDVNIENFLHVLKGNKAAMQGKGSSKVLESGPNDHVFVFFADHGGPGVIQFPDLRLLHAQQLIDALHTMHDSKMYKKLVFYLGTCKSGSMFENLLPTDINVLAITSTNSTELGHSCLYYSELHTFVGDQFGYAWMGDIDSGEYFNTFSTETLEEQYQRVYSLLTSYGEDGSHPQMYGDRKIGSNKVKDFVGESKNTYKKNKPVGYCEHPVPSRDVEIYILKEKIEETDDLVKKTELIQQLNRLLQSRQSGDELFSRILKKMTRVDSKRIVEHRQPLTQEMMPCYKTVVDYFNNNCVKNTDILAHFYKFANLCAEKVPADYIIKVIDEECTEDTPRQ